MRVDRSQSGEYASLKRIRITHDVHVNTVIKSIWQSVLCALHTLRCDNFIKNMIWIYESYYYYHFFNGFAFLSWCDSNEIHHHGLFNRFTFQSTSSLKSCGRLRGIPDNMADKVEVTMYLPTKLWEISDMSLGQELTDRAILSVCVYIILNFLSSRGCFIAFSPVALSYVNLWKNDSAL